MIRTSMLTDFYQMTIAYAYFEEGRQDEPACFDLFYRKQPFGGSFAVFAGLQEALEMIRKYKFTEDDLTFLKAQLPGVSDGFIDYLRNFDTSKLKIVSFTEGSIVFPREPLLRVEGPIGYCQLIETPLLNAINFPTLMTTNAMRFRLRAKDVRLMEFGLRRAQGPDGALAASRYAYIGGFDATSNVLAGHVYGIPVSGTVAHSFILSFTDKKQLKTTSIAHKETGEMVDLWPIAQRVLADLGAKTNQSELVAFCSQAIVYPNNFLALVDTYDTVESGVPNFLAIALGLHTAGYRAIGVRLDSGDLPVLSRKVRAMYVAWGEKYSVDYGSKIWITASNDINETELIRFNKEGHEMDAYGIGTHLVTCQRQPALGGVYKLVEIAGVPRVKLSESVGKATLPCKKAVYRVLDETGKEIADLMTLESETPEPGQITAFQVYPEAKEVTVAAASLKSMLVVSWDGKNGWTESVDKVRDRAMRAKANFNSDVLAVDDEKQFSVLISQALHRVLLDCMETAKATSE